MLARAAESLGISSIGHALDELRDLRQLRATNGHLALAHSLAQQSWRETINQPRRERLAKAWFAAVAEYDVFQLTGPDAVGLIPIITTPLLESRPPADIADIGERLVLAGQSRTGLELLDNRWRLAVSGGPPAEDVFRHAMIAARTRLELGRYREADDSLEKAQEAGRGKPDATAEVSLLRMKLALRRNRYAALWELAKQLELMPEQSVEAQIERELILNVAYRDLLKHQEIKDSVDRLVKLSGLSTLHRQNSIDRALARSLAKLGDYDNALVRARGAVASSSGLESIQVVGNSRLALAEVLRYRRDFVVAIAAYRYAAAIGRATGNRDLLLWALLGEAAAHIEDETPQRAWAPLNEVAALLAEPGYEHPLEAAHAGLLDIFARRSGAAPEEVLRRYEALAVDWPVGYVRSFLTSGRTLGPTPI
ncbi:MAG: hypothetical protein L0312_32525 [Acidobacteria bacterium]|nr:hypothetical protein [Acidobacteriota bacterium]